MTPQYRPNGGPAELSVDLVASFFDTAIDDLFYVKDKDLRYVAVNNALKRLCGVRRKEDLIGKSTGEFFAEEVRDRYEAIDRRVLTSGRPLTNDLGLSRSKKGDSVWLRCAHWPIFDHTGKISGVAGVSRVLGLGNRVDRICQRVKTSVDKMRASLGEASSVETLANELGVSRGQLTRDFVAVLDVSPQTYLSRARIERAIELLKTDASIANVALACGYFDQSAFTRRFKQVTGLPPGSFRQRVPPVGRLSGGVSPSRPDFDA